MAGELNEIMSTLHKISAEMSSFSARQEQLEAAQEHSSKHQEESLNELREVINEAILGGKRPERDKGTQPAEGELYSPSDQPSDFGDLATPNTSNMSTAPVSIFTSSVPTPNLSPRPAASNPITSEVSSAPIQLPRAQPQPPTRSVMISNPPFPRPPPYVFPNMPSPHPRSAPLQPLNFPIPPSNGRGYQPLMGWTQGSHTWLIPPQSTYTQPIPFPPSYYTHPGHIPSPLYHQTPYAPNLPQYQYNTITSNQSQTQNNHTTPLPNIPYTKYTKVDFPKFDGEDLRTWLYKVEQIFADEEATIQQRMKLVSLHFEGDALQCHLGYMRSRGQMPLPTWEEYLWALCDSFGAEYSDPMTELMNIKHTSSVKDYQKAFVSVMTRINLSTEHAISIFLNNLKPELSNAVKIGNPTSLPQAYYLARLQEASFAAQCKAIKGTLSTSSLPKPFTNQGSPSIFKGNQPSYRKPVAPVFYNNRRRRLTPTEMDEKRANGICFFYDEKFTPGHKCKAKRQLYSLELEEEQTPLLEAPETEEEEFIEAKEEEQEHAENCEISLEAMKGSKGYKTLRIQGFTEQRPINVLIDNGSTHNFIDEQTAKRLGCKVYQMNPQDVLVADRRVLQSVKGSKGFTWLMQGVVFTDDFLVLPIGSCDVVSGIQWLCMLGDIQINFAKLWMQFSYQGKSITSQGNSPSFKTVQAKTLNSVPANTTELFMIRVCHKEDPEKESFPKEDGTSMEIQVLLEGDREVFEEPKQLPPSRGVFDHHIPLVEGSIPVNSRPYRYSPIQKDVIEQITQEMLNQGIIQYSSSPYASPVVLVSKKDGSRRLCVDYRALNKLTIKDKFPIPIIEELLDELGGSTIYSKIDLRAGYHQIRMSIPDIHKTAFRTHSGHYEYLVMPFGLTDAPSSFQGMMNHIFKTYMRKFILVFFDDILVFSKSLDDHVQHLRITFELLVQHQLFAKKSKCVFATDKIEYLGHYISAAGVATDPKKIEAVQAWPTPVSLKQLRGFLGLAGYYRRFIKGYGVLSKPLTDLLKKDSFQWSCKATEAFSKLKEAITSAPILTLPDFSIPFGVETDACSLGIGAVLMQNGQPIAYLSKGLSPQHQSLSVYDKELLALVMAVSKWTQYLTGKSFTVKTDQKALKFLLEQKLHTGSQLKWITKLMQYDFIIEYKKGKENKAIDALSRLPLIELAALTLSTLKSTNAELNGYSFVHEQLRRNRKLVVGPDDQLRKDIIQLWHNSIHGGHSGIDHTYRRLAALFYWKAMREDVMTHVKQCDTCQRSKYETTSYPGLLQPLKLPSLAWSSINMDFIEGLPKSQGKSVIWVVVDRLTKYAHFIGVSHPYSASDIARLFMDHVFKLHGMPEDIVSDMDPVFTSKLWQELFSMHGVTLSTSTAYHPQSDSQTEVVNRCFETYLRCFCSDSQKDWFSYLAVAEWWYNTTFHSSIQTTPYEALYGQPPPLHLPYIAGDSVVEEVDRSMITRELKFQLLKYHLQRAQQRMTIQANRHRSDR
ncbi:PREDICTED: uncharacterized protein LOC109232588 [Nicotiana attenuata]|uniref:uncharacterized protein LOC109232588 n=1 Tax=Nicotiana attenuata TaxID=49451 RepID=UPI000905C51C|nr:PREDICTED: uncharacterized protein LOC109232588 [Nicotiana attenuata]